MIKKEKLGNRLQCSVCNTKFYDFNKPNPVCPKCGGAPIQKKQPVVKASPAPVDIEIEPENIDIGLDDAEIVPIDELEEDFLEYNDNPLS